MIIDNTYFSNELYIPHAKPSISSDSTTVSADLDAFIEKYERECLIKCLGFQLYAEFLTNIDIAEATLIKAGADVKWGFLMNGKSYTDPQGKAVVWRGIRFKNLTTGSYDRSFLTNYVYYHYEQNFDIFRTGVGVVVPKGKNSEKASSAPKVVRAWREMADMIQGKQFHSNVIIKDFGVGIDYYHANSEKTLYEFILDMNDATPDTYADFTPAHWEVRKNQFGI